MPFVLDASVAGSWVLADETSEAADRVAQELLTEDAVGPLLWWYEVRNLLVVFERRGRLDTSDTELFLSRLKDNPIHIDNQAEWDDTMRLARKHRLTIYEASSLEIAIRSKLSLATLDAALRSIHAAFSFSINAIFLSRRQPLNCFSRATALLKSW